MNIFILSLSLILPVISLPFLIFVALIERFRPKWILFLISLTLGLIVYAYSPTPSKDIYRQYEKIEYMHKGGYDALIEYTDKGGSKLFLYFLYFCSLINWFNFLPLFLVTCSYLLYFLGMRQIITRAGSTDFIYIFILTLWIFSTMSYPFLISSLRQPFAVALFFYILQKENISILYIIIVLAIAMMFHVTGALMAGSFIVVYLWNEKKWTLMIFFISIFSVLSLFSGSLGLSSGVEEKMDLYADANEVSIKILALSYINISVVSLISLQLFYRKCKLRLGEEKFPVIFTLSTLLFLNQPIVFQRLTFFVPLFFFPVSLRYFRESKDWLSLYGTLFCISLACLYGTRLTIANFGGLEFWPEFYYRDVFSILLFAKNYCLTYL
ncbi:MAG: hypothetical protein D3903_01965 [Candidatus Electrothrix sp. GM3_4]|nr:hypothetical protein [Candidatus Electrothrix sp. GM3_4]